MQNVLNSGLTTKTNSTFNGLSNVNNLNAFSNTTISESNILLLIYFLDIFNLGRFNIS